MLDQDVVVRVFAAILQHTRKRCLLFPHGVVLAPCIWLVSRALRYLYFTRLWLIVCLVFWCHCLVSTILVFMSGVLPHGVGLFAAGETLLTHSTFLAGFLGPVPIVSGLRNPLHN